MPTLTGDGQRIVADIARRHGVSSDAASHLLAAIVAGGGRQAQFNHPELGGMGQWSQGGMIMIGDMFNNGLKARVAALCSDLAEALQGSAELARQEPQPWNAAGDLKSFAHRWPPELGAPASTGSQNDLHYAIFPGSRRLAIEQRGHITVYDTEDHRIGGVSQQQGGDQSLRFVSQSGPVRLSELRIVRGDWESGSQAPEPAPPEASAMIVRQPAGKDTQVEQQAPPPRATAQELAPASAPLNDGDDAIFSRLERLAELRSRDIITAEEFAAKKAELLARL